MKPFWLTGSLFDTMVVAMSNVSRAHQCPKEALARYSCRSISKMQSLLQGRTSQNPSGAFKRKVSTVFGPFRYCFETVQLRNKQEGKDPIQFQVASMKRLLSCVSSMCPSLGHRLAHVEQGKLEAILAHDECTAGNVLNPLLRQKVLLFYVTFVQLKDCLESQRAWLPVAAITHDQLSEAAGGIAAATAAFLRHWDHEQLESFFPIAPDVKVKVELKFFISDLDSQRAAMAAKGSAGLKPCLFCMNCIARYAGDSCSDDSFRTVEEHDMSRFQQYERNDLETYILQWMALAEHMPKCDRDLRERCLGFNLDKDSLWGCPRSRALLHIDKIQNDSLHCYFSNGICNSEIILILNLAKENLGVDVSDLATACLDAGWKRHLKTETRHWCKRLWKECQFGEGVYKGSAGDTLALCSLLRWIVETHWLSMPCMAEASKCFLQLCRCVDVLRCCKYDSASWTALATEQEKHQKAFVSCYPNQTRPKHHCRMHLPEQYQKHGIAASCWGVESAHRNYKGVFADLTRHFLRSEEGGLEFSKQLLPRLLLRSVELLNERPLLQHGFELLRPFSEEEVLERVGISNARLSASCRLEMNELHEKDFLLLGQTCDSACQIHFFVEKANSLYIYCTRLALISSGDSFRIFKFTKTKEMVKYARVKHVHVPAWTAAKNDTVMFLP